MECDHVVAVVPEHSNIMKNNKIEITINPIKIRASDYTKDAYRKVFNNEKFTFCPECGKKIDWEILEKALAQCN